VPAPFINKDALRKSHPRLRNLNVHPTIGSGISSSPPQTAPDSAQSHSGCFRREDRSPIDEPRVPNVVAPVELPYITQQGEGFRLDVKRSAVAGARRTLARAPGYAV